MKASDKGPGVMLAIGMPAKGPDGSSPKGGDSSNLDCVPLSALNMPDEQEQMQAPEVGDKVQYTVEGTVSRIDGDEAYVSRDTINGQPAGDSPTDQEPDDDDNAAPQDDESSPEYGELEKMAGRTQLQ